LTGGGHTASRRPVLQAWIPALIWLVIIAIESTGLLSSENTGRFLYPLLHFLFGVDPLRFALWHFLLRKSGHVVGYGILSVLLFRAWRATIAVPSYPRWSMVWARIALSMTALVASLDELHQSFLPSRTGTIHDVLLDSAAGLAAQLLLYLVLRGWRTSNHSETPAHEPDEAMKQPAPDPTGV
jgi:VanZ family protein